MPDSLYDRDFYAWTREQAEILRAESRRGNNAPVDWENVAEEIEDMGDVKWDEIESRLGLLIVHLLKLIYCEDLRERNARQWLLTIREQRRAIPKRLKRSPSLRPMLNDEFATVYAEARGDAALEADIGIEVFPVDPPFSLVQVLASDFPDHLIPERYRLQG